MTAVIEVAGICKSYVSIEVLKNVSLSVDEGEAFAIIGPNGAGKTTLFKVMTGEVSANAGQVRYRGTDVTRLPAADRINAGFGRTFQVARIFPEFSVVDNIVVAIEARSRLRASRKPRSWPKRSGSNASSTSTRATSRTATRSGWRSRSRSRWSRRC
jgi:branched-chain amino acid transport system ATP-binding protein